MVPVIFIADDDKDDYNFLKEAFDESGEKYILEHFENGIDLINALMSNEKKSQLPGLIILDINMPKMDGITALEVIRNIEKLTHIPVFMHSTTNTHEQIKKCYALGANSFFTKGSLKALRKFVKSAVELLKDHKHEKNAMINNTITKTAIKH